MFSTRISVVAIVPPRTSTFAHCNSQTNLRPVPSPNEGTKSNVGPTLNRPSTKNLWNLGQSISISFCSQDPNRQSSNTKSNGRDYPILDTTNNIKIFGGPHHLNVTEGQSPIFKLRPAFRHAKTRHSISGSCKILFDPLLKLGFLQIRESVRFSPCSLRFSFDFFPSLLLRISWIPFDFLFFCFSHRFTRENRSRIDFFDPRTQLDRIVLIEGSDSDWEGGRFGVIVRIRMELRDFVEDLIFLHRRFWFLTLLRTVGWLWFVVEDVDFDRSLLVWVIERWWVVIIGALPAISAGAPPAISLGGVGA